MVCMLYTYMILVWYAHIICDVFVSSFLRFLVSFSVVSLFPRFFVSSFLRFLVSSFPRFFVSSFPRFFVSSFLCFLVSSFLCFLVSSFLRFFVSSCPLAGSTSQVGGAVSLCFFSWFWNIFFWSSYYFFLILLIFFLIPIPPVPSCLLHIRSSPHLTQLVRPVFQTRPNMGRQRFPGAVGYLRAIF